MMVPLKLKDIPAGFGDRFPDGDYTVGRGADPRGMSAVANKPDVASRPKKSRRAAAEKRPARPAAE